MASAKKDLLDRELAQVANAYYRVPTMPALDPAGADARLRESWARREASFVEGLASAPAAGRALFMRAKAFVDAGLPRGRHDADEQAAFYVVAGTAFGTTASWHDFLGRWVTDGGMAYALEVALRVAQLRTPIDRDAPSTLTVLSATETPSLSGYWLIAALAPELAALSADARATLRREAATLAARAAPHGAAWTAIALADEALAVDAIARAESAALSYADPWPQHLFEVLRDGAAFGTMLSRGGQALQFFGAGYVLRARGRVAEADLADALVRFFSAALAEPRRMHDAYVTKFAAVACTIAHPHLAWLFQEHAEHRWFAKHAPWFASRNPGVVPARPPEASLGARLVPLDPPPRPPGFSRAELAALDPEERERRLLDTFRVDQPDLRVTGHAGAALVLEALADHPIPSVAVALHQRITSRDFATQMPKPGFHKELQADLAALADRHPPLKEALRGSSAGSRGKKRG